MQFNSIIAYYCHFGPLLDMHSGELIILACLPRTLLGFNLFSMLMSVSWATFQNFLIFRSSCGIHSQAKTWPWVWGGGPNKIIWPASQIFRANFSERPFLD